MRYYTELPGDVQERFLDNMGEEGLDTMLEPGDVAPYSGKTVSEIVEDVHGHVEKTAKYHDLTADPDDMSYVVLRHGQTYFNTYMAAIYIRPRDAQYPVMILSDLIYSLDPESYMPIVRHEVAHYEEYLNHGVKNEGEGPHKMYCQMMDANVTFNDALDTMGLRKGEFYKMHRPERREELRKI